MKYVRKLTFSVLLLVLLLAGCDSVEPKDEAPALISAEAFEMQMDLFEDEAASKAAVGENFPRARFGVFFISTALRLHLIIPHVVTAAALQADPIIEDGTWTWSSEAYPGHGNEVHFTLSATPFANTDSSGIDWSMVISTTDTAGTVLEDFELYTARTSLDGTSGSWQLFYKLDLDEDGVEERTNVLNADFTVTSDTQKEILFTVAAGEHAGGSIRYARADEDRTFHLTTADEAEYLVTWNAETKAGSFTETNDDGVAQGCWGPAPDFEDVECD